MVTTLKTPLLATILTVAFAPVRLASPDDKPTIHH